MQIHRKSLFFLRVGVDIILLLLAYGSTIAFAFSPDYFFISKYQLLIVILVGFWVFIAKNLGLYDEFRSRSFLFELTLLLQFIFLVGVSTVVLIFILGITTLNRSFLLFFLSELFISLGVTRWIFRLVLDHLRKRGKNSRSLVIIGAGEIGTQFYNQVMNNPNFGYRVFGVLDDFEKPHMNGDYLGEISKLDSILTENQIDDVIVALPNYATEKLQEVISICENHTTRVKIIPDYFKYTDAAKFSVSMFGNLPLISIREDRLNEIHWRLIKRIFDIVVSTVAFILLFSWLWPIIAILIKMSSKGPVFFTQERWGKDNERFLAFKFRSMRPDSKDVSETGKYNQATKDDPRITTIGKFLRKSNLDELPQFINVLLGDMSIVGPRPHPTPLNIESRDKVDLYMLRHLIKPGITGWAQVNGARGETKDPFAMQKRVNLDIWYIENWTFWLDVQIIFMTVWNMVRGDKNAY